MQIYTYETANGLVTIEVDEMWHELLSAADTEEANAARKHTRPDHKYAPGEPLSLSNLKYEGQWFADQGESISHVDSTIDLERAMSALTELQRRYVVKVLTARDREIDKLYNAMFEANSSGKIDDLRFAKMSSQYTAEQKEIAEKIKGLSAELDKQTGKTMSTDMFISTVRKYTRAKKLTERMLSELIEKIEVHHIEKVDGANIQRVTIRYNCVGAIDIPPETLTLPEITVQTRRGVTVNYAPA
jgi:hypothetical protein